MRMHKHKHLPSGMEVEPSGHVALAPTRARPGPVATNERAEEELCLSVYLEQPASSNRSRCWN